MHRSTVGFERSTSAYDHGRPEYPPEAALSLLRHCRVGPSTSVLELGAGTGKFTGYIRQCTSHVLASDPSAAMRTSFAKKWPDIACVGARADHLPLRSSSMSAIICAQAFHWFADSRSIAEMVRVLAAGGFLGFAWNVRDERVAWIAELTRIIDVYSDDTPRYRTGAWRRALAASAELEALQEESHIHVVTCDRTTVLDRVASISFIAALDPIRHAEVLKQVNDLLDTHAETRGRTMYEMPHRTDVQWCRRK